RFDGVDAGFDEDGTGHGAKLIHALPPRCSSKITSASSAAALRTACSRFHRASSAAALGDASSSAGSSSRLLVGRMITSVNGTTAPRSNPATDRKSTRLNSSHQIISYAV